MSMGRERETRRPMRRLLVIDRFLRIDSTCEPFVLRSRGGVRILRANSTGLEGVIQVSLVVSIYSYVCL